ncbi:hypothetical protein EV188_101446 [Actinomycetospora succinea]|uniref:Uncharacterized protein n=2 Tax=Actinomycetospora succinea TaxID=663603 RepID=A0A4R6VRJ4_9PSEU|nr:hypothetical protein EV188_101446 [Actinomycetospora succinea]
MQHTEQTPCRDCGSTRTWMARQVVHHGACPHYGRRLDALDRSQRNLFEHPDLVELDLFAAAWYEDFWVH